MPFGLKIAGQTFQRHMDNVIRGLEFVFVYIDDILVSSTDETEHLTHLHTLFQCLRENGLVVNLAKCEFGVNEINFLAHDISQNGIAPSQDNVHAIVNFPPPSTVKQLQQFLGMINFYHRFIPQAACYLKPLYSVTSGRSNSTTEWTSELSSAFQNAKDALAQATVLSHPVANAHTCIAVDASEIASEVFYNNRLKDFGSHWHFSAVNSERLRSNTALMTASY